MSQENVEMARAAFGAFSRGDLDATFRDAAPGFEFDISRAIAVDSSWPVDADRGVLNLARTRELAEQFATSWERGQYEAHDFIEAGDHVVTPVVYVLSAPNGTEVQARGTWVWTFRQGVIVRLAFYRERHQALDAAGLRE
jgi:ketosteroid isomerase-like protein